MSQSPTNSADLLSRRSFLQAAAGTGALLAMGACGNSGSSKANPTSTTPGAALRPTTMRPTTITTCVYAKNHASAPLYWQHFAPKGITVT